MRASRRFFMMAASAATLSPTGPWAQAPAETPPPEAPPASPSPAPGGAPGLPTLLPEPGDPANVDEVELSAKPVLILAGQSKWDDGYKTIRAAISRIEQELGRLGIAPAGRPLVLYTQTGDDDFKFDAMVPAASAPASPPADLAKDMRFGQTPAGKAFRFTHKGPYDDIDGTYETVTTYLEAKDIVASDAFMEEFVNDISDPADDKLEVNIFVQPK